MKTLHLENLYFKYPMAEKYAVCDISLKFNKSEKCVILGKNGMGKSTLFFLVNGVLTPEKGSISIDDTKISKKNINFLRQNIGLVFQDPESQFVAPSVEEEISFGPLNLHHTKEDVSKIVNDICKNLHIEHLKNKSLYSLSGGEKKLVSIGSVLAMNPSIIFFDEPTAGLDYPNSVVFKNVLEELATQDLGLVISTHDIDFAWEWADRIIILKSGKIIADGSFDILTDKNLMEDAELRRPMLVDFAEMSGLENYPRNMEELKNLIN